MSSVASSSSVVFASSMMYELCCSFGVELAIFALTFLFALVIKRGSVPPAAMRKRAKIMEKVEHEEPRNQSSYDPGLEDAPKVIIEVVEGMRDRGASFGMRALGKHAELRRLLRAECTTLAGAVTCHRYSHVEFYSALVQAAIAVCRPALVRDLVRDMAAQGVPRTLTFYEIAMKQLARQKHFHIALDMYDHLAEDGLEPSAVTYSCLTSFAAEVGELNRAVFFFERLAAVTVPSIRAYMTVLRVHARRQDWTASRAVLRDMERRGVPVDALALNVVLSTGVSMDRMEAVDTLLEEADKRDPPLADIVSYNTVIKGHARRGDVGRAVDVLRRAQARGLRPNAITFNTAMDAAVRGGRTGDVVRLLEDMRTSGMRPDKFTCSILIKSLARGATTKRVEDVLEILREVGPTCDDSLRTAMFHSLLDAATTCDSDYLVVKAYAQMRLQRVVPTGLANRVVSRALGREDVACKQLWERMLGAEAEAELQRLRKKAEARGMQLPAAAAA